MGKRSGYSEIGEPTLAERIREIGVRAIAKMERSRMAGVTAEEYTRRWEGPAWHRNELDICYSCNGYDGCLVSCVCPYCYEHYLRKY